MAAKRNPGDSPEKGHKKNPLYREHRLLPRKRAESGTVAKMPAPISTQSSKGKKASPPPDNAETAETGGPDGPEPTRYGDWERKGRCVDF